MNKLFAELPVIAAATFFVAGPAFAHHPLAGAPMETFVHGVLSGIGHPVIGFDHLFFVALVGLAAALAGRLVLLPVGYIAAMLAGTLLSTAGLALPMVEAAIALSLLALGGVLVRGRGLETIPALLVFVGFGLFHGSAFGASVAGQESALGAPVLIGYLLGLGGIQYLISLGCGWGAGKAWDLRHPDRSEPRIAGAAVAGVGLFLVLEIAEVATFAALGVG
ncbi:MAG: HupE/UreJ family protein [Paracoccaceae bacterium]|nr:HupE/UreJ family protein [Paracoccaceae bacterium]